MVASEDSNNLFRRTYRRGWIVFGYGLIWLTALAVAFTLPGQLLVPDGSINASLPAAAVASALAGGIGGVTAMWQRLGRHLLGQPNTQGQSLFSFLLQPLTGLVAGILSLFLVALPGTLLVNYAATRTLSLADVAASSTFAALQLLLAWIAGYYQDRLTKQRSDTDSRSTSKALAATGPDTDSPLALKAWVEQRRRLIRWSVSGGIFILIYGVIWLIGLLAGFLGGGALFPTQADGNQPLVNLLATGWPALLAGGLGGVIGMLYDLYRRISLERDFDLPHLIAYLTLPLTGLVLGGATYLFIASGYLSLKSVVSEAPPAVDAPAVIAIYLVLGWIVGFRQESLHGLIRRVIQAVIDFFRFGLSLLSPKLLWDQAKRADALSEIGQQQELFRPLDRSRS